MLSEANALFILMKEKADRLLIQETKLQDFLDWILQSSEFTKVSFNPAAIRASYCLLTLKKQIFAIIFDISEDTFHFFRPLILRDVAHIFNEFSSHTVNQMSLLSFDNNQYYLFVGFNCYLDRTLPDWNLPEKLLGDDRYPKLFYDFFRELAKQSILVDRIFHVQEYPIQQLAYTPVEDSHIKLKLEHWWKANCHASVKQYESQIHQNDENKSVFQFTEEEKIQLKQFYDANELLIDCLNTDCCVNYSVREEIEETLLLPIAEIEKRQQLS